MNFTDIFIRRPVLATVVSLMILVLGLRAAGSLSVSQFPHTENAVISVSTTYYGADADVVASYITTPLEAVIAQASGIDYLTSSSKSGSSTITAYLRLNYDGDKAMTEISAKVNAVLNQLPPESQRPILSLQMGQVTPAMFIGLNSDVLPSTQLADYALRVVVPRLQAIEGVQEVQFGGGKGFAMRAWLDPTKLAALNLTASDVYSALAANNYIAGLGTTRGQMVQVNLAASTNLHSVEDFRNLVLKTVGGTIIRLQDVATVDLGTEDYDSIGAFDGKQAILLAVQVAPSANLFDVMRRAHKVIPDLKLQLPQGVHLTVAYDSSDFISGAIKEVVRTLIEALLIVTLVVFAFLGSPRSALIPAIAIPLSLVGTLTIMLALGFSLNLLTLLALVLSIGLVVDDAIIVVENINRHMEEGMARTKASLLAARELAGPIVAMTVVLIAVYVPIAFQGGLTGALFTEFAFTLVGAITVSAIVALTLSPMLSSRLLRSHVKDGGTWEDGLVRFIDRRFDSLHRYYAFALHESLNSVAVIVVFALTVLVSIYFLYTTARDELAPQEDGGFMAALMIAPPSSTLQQRELFMEQAAGVFSSVPEVIHSIHMDTPDRALIGIALAPWDKRKRTMSEVQGPLQKDLNQIAGFRVAIFQPPPLPVGFGLPVQFVIGSTQPFDRMNDVGQAFLEQTSKMGMFSFLSSDLKIDLLQTTVEIDRDKAAQLGLNMTDVGRAMTTMLGGGYVNYFAFDGRAYKVIPQVQQNYRLNPQQLLDYHLRIADGSVVPLSTIAHLSTKTIPESLPHFQQLNSVTIQGVLAPGVAMGDALDALRALAARTLPAGYSVDYGGTSRQYMQESSGFLLTFVFALIIIFLSLAALFESFRDPLIILVSVPMSIAGALVFISTGIGGTTLNIYTEVGLVTLMGLISKHGILIVEFANAEQHRGKPKREAVELAAATRLRPILMTTAAMVLGVMPLLLASGPGAGARFNLGLVIASGISIGTLFTLFVVPAAYLILAADHTKDGVASDLSQESAVEY
ncbi:MAG: multidrug efflux protein [Rhodospirillaceae bacterium]|nr:MAG: multidrug efflux protein [Rhodospirillaceae bacterium]